MKNRILLSVSVLAILFSGCDTSDTTTQVSVQDIEVQRGPVHGAYVTDSVGNRAQYVGDGKYSFYKNPTYPVSVYGGYIDVDRDGQITTADTELTVPMIIDQQSSEYVTLATTLATNATIKNTILTQFGLSETELYSLKPNDSAIIAALSDEVFKYCTQNSILVEDIDPTVFLNTIVPLINTRINTINQSSDTLIETIKQLETQLVIDLGINLTEQEVTDALTDIQNSQTQVKDPTTIADKYPMYDLTIQNEQDLLFMYEEEKMARDLYIALYNQHGLKIFNNIKNSEQQHMDAIKSLLDKYSISYSHINDTSGVYQNTDLQALYNTLLTTGQASITDALNVGKTVEETDITDINALMPTGADDIDAVYQNLLNGSYNHLNAFTKQLN